MTLTLNQLAVLTTVVQPMTMGDMAQIVDERFGIESTVSRDCCWQLRNMQLLAADGPTLFPTNRGLREALTSLDTLNKIRTDFAASLRRQGVL